MVAVVLAAVSLFQAPAGISFQLGITPNFWSRDADAGSCAPAGERFKVVHRGAKDWAVQLGPPIKVRAGDRVRIESKIDVVGTGDTGLSFVLNGGGRTVDWLAGHQGSSSGVQQTSKASVLIPAGVDTVQPRLTGTGPSEVTFGPVMFQLRRGEVLSPAQRSPIELRNAILRVRIDPQSLAVEATDLRTGATWKQRGVNSAFSPTKLESSNHSVRWTGLLQDGDTAATVSVTLDAKRPELLWRIEGNGSMPAEVAIPGPFVATATTEHVLPMNMGIRYRANDPAVEPQWLHSYGGHGLCMAFYAQAEPRGGVLNIIETSDDFMMKLDRRDGLLEARPGWQPQLSKFGYPRVLRTVFLSKGDIVTIADRYREHAQSVGLRTTLSAKARRNRNVRRVAGAANLWTWGDKLPLAKAAHAAGLRNVLWSGGGSPDELKAIQRLGFVTSRYDIYQDVMDPSKFPDLPWKHPDWTTEAWPDKLVRDAKGDYVRGWVVQDKQGKDVPCAVCCDREAIAFAEKRISGELKTHPFEARFIDTTTASEYRECYDPRHAMTRTDCKRARMALLQRVTDFGLVTGSETGVEASVPHLVFFEGMMSLGPYRVPDAGTDPPKLYDTLPASVLKFQLGPKYRIPLWQLVYGDCTVSTWYWGDFNNKNAATWDLRDRWNMLYGTPPMYFTDAAGFERGKSRFVRSYRDTMSVLRHAAMHRMTAFRDLTPDRTVQQTEWDNGLKVTVNFGAKPALGIAPGGVKVTPPRSR